MVKCTYRQISTVALCMMVSLSLFLAVPGLCAERNPRIGVRGGYSFITGYYDTKLDGGPSIGVYVIPLVWKYLMIECDSDFSYYPIHGTESSALMSYSLSVGPHFYYSIKQRVALYAGTLLRGSVFQVNAPVSGDSGASVKLGFSLSAGVIIPLPKGVELRIGYVFSENDLTRKVFMCHNACVGVAYGFASAKGPGQDAEKAREASARYKDGIDSYNKGDFEAARESLTKVLQLDPGYPEAKERLDSIQTACDNYSRAIEIKKNGDPVQALKILRDVDPKMRTAADERETISRALMPRVPVLVEQAMKEYDEKNYGAAVNTFETILLIDPQNQQAKLYLPRARTRYDAYRKLK